ncbi:MAG: hypothetical protein LBS93_03780 [Synergistaceae bacterium]|nr:hypothetical protein [Synergistaceae bacterium]
MLRRFAVAGIAMQLAAVGSMNSMLVLCIAWFFLYKILAADSRRRVNIDGDRFSGVSENFAPTLFSLLAASLIGFLGLCAVALLSPSLMEWLAGYPEALVLTLAMEGAAAYVLGYRTRRELGCALLCSLVTHPAIHLALCAFFALFAVPFFELWDIAVQFFELWDICVAFLETAVVLAEYKILRATLPWKGENNARLAVVMNLTSYLGGFLIYWVLAW